MDISTATTLACIWEATAAKPGNVYRGADFEDATYADFLTSAVVLGQTIPSVDKFGVGAAVLESVRAINYVVNTNTYLGTILLLAPLAACPREYSLSEGLQNVLNSFTDDDVRFVYAAICLANPGGLGEVDQADVHKETPAITLVEAMQLAADRDLVARQYTNGFAEVFATATRIESLEGPLSERIVRGFLELLAKIPDTLITRKCGPELSQEVSDYARRVLSYADDDYYAALADFDFWLRSDGHRRNPGTSADIVAAALFVLLRENRIQWPVKFY